MSYDPNRTPRPEIVVAVEEVMRTAWHPPAEVSEEVLLKADSEARRFARDWDRLSKQVKCEGDQDEIWKLMAHANRLLDFLIAAPVQSATTAAASMRHLIGGPEDKGGLGRGIKECMVDESHRAGFARILEWLEAEAGTHEDRS
jgi:hypothetical protein